MTATILMQPLRASGIFCSETNEIHSRYTELHVPLTESIHLKTVCVRVCACVFFFNLLRVSVPSDHYEVLCWSMRY